MSRNTKSSSTIPEDEEARKLSLSSMSSSSSGPSSRKPSSSREPSISTLSVSSNKERKKITENFKKEQEEWREKQEKESIFREGNQIEDALHKAREDFKRMVKETRGMIDEIRNAYDARELNNDGYDGGDEEISMFSRRRKKRRTKKNPKGGKKKTKKKRTIKKKDIFKYLPDSIEYHRKNYN